MSDWSDGLSGSMTSNTGISGGGTSSMMSFLPAGLTLLGAISSYNGYQTAAAATVAAGQSQAAMYQFKAAQEKVNAGQAVAAGQANAVEIARQAQLATSHNLALIAAGGTSGSISAIRAIGKQAGMTSYAQSVALYQGEDQARSLTMAAEADNLSADAAIQNADAQAQGLQTKGDSALISGAGSLFSKYGSSFFSSMA